MRKIQKSDMKRNPFASDVDKNFYYEEQWRLLEAQLHRLKKPNGDDVFEASRAYIKNSRQNLHALIYKYSIMTPDDDAVVALCKRIDEEAEEKLRRGRNSSGAEGLKMAYYYTMKNWNDSLRERGDKIKPLQSRRFKVPYRAGTDYVYSRDDIKRLIDACDNDRDKAIIVVAAGSGIRRKELQYLRVEDLDMDLNGLVVKDHGQQLKTFTEHQAALVQGSKPLLQKWLAVRAKFLQDKNIQDPGWLFITESGTQMDDSTMYQIVRRAQDRSGVRVKGALHGFRRYSITNQSLNGTSTGVSKTLHGHKRVATTESYQRFSNEELKHAVRNVKLF
jgi:integrase